MIRQHRIYKPHLEDEIRARERLNKQITTEACKAAAEEKRQRRRDRNVDWARRAGLLP